MPRYTNEYFRFKSIRDPLYGFIDLSETETRIIDTPVFRRLHGIKQLSHAYLVYPTAIHTRFEHSLGVTHLADRISKQLSLDDEVREVVRLAALLHDVGHGPFSHLFEAVLERVNGKKIDHDKISMMLIREDPDISSILGDMGEKVIRILDRRPAPGLDRKISSLATDIVSSPLDVDKMDYLRRDSYHIGVAYGQFDLPRIIHMLTHTDDKREQRICVDSKGKDSDKAVNLDLLAGTCKRMESHVGIASQKQKSRVDGKMSDIKQKALAACTRHHAGKIGELEQEIGELEQKNEGPYIENIVNSKKGTLWHCGTRTEEKKKN